MDKRRREVRILSSRLIFGTMTRNTVTEKRSLISPAFNPFHVPPHRDTEQVQQRICNVPSVPSRVTVFRIVPYPVPRLFRQLTPPQLPIKRLGERPNESLKIPLTSPSCPSG
jgi:hypothetical protein